LAVEPFLESEVTDAGVAVAAAGAWTALHAERADRLAAAAPRPAPGVTRYVVDMAGVTALDTFGAWVLERLVRQAAQSGAEAQFVSVPARFRALVEEVHGVNRREGHAQPPLGPVAALLDTARQAGATLWEGAASFLTMLGAVGVALVRIVAQPSRFRLTSAVHHLDRVGWQAIGIILMITFLIGGIIAQQGIFHFRQFGADDYVVDLVGILVLREIGVLIVAIMVAGRSGSSYTAEIGSMKMREEIDALRTMGLDPVEILILPRLLALIVALPVLAFVGSMAALYGGGLVAWLYGGMSPAVFIARLKEAVTVTHFAVGMIKAPFMALVIGVVAAAEGLRVKGSAESLGLQTTTSVVKAIFLVIVLDGLFAVFFSSIGM
jgi:phospholipid/cholesterol/gamma-HCH transport system permease protein